MNKLKRHFEWGKILEFVIIFGILPTIIFAVIGSRWPGVLRVIYYVIVTAFVMQAAMSYLNSIVAARRRHFKPKEGAAPLPPVPKATFIVSAYMPNEVDVIEPTLLNLLDNVNRPASGIEVILAYNTDHLVGIEQKLKDMAVKYPELILANAHRSHSKSENLNCAVDLASGQIIVLLDADHMVAADCLERAWRWLAGGYDIVQGRCKIRNGGSSGVSALVEVEFEGIYSVSHYAKSKLFDTALFGGSDAYWKADVIKKVRFVPERLTEDIDATLRALLQGYRIVHDRSIISRELAPEDLSGLWYQRKRWSQGWFQCSLVHQKGVLQSTVLSRRAKFIWTWLLAWRVIYDVIANLLFPVVFAYWLVRGRIEFPMDGYIWFTLIFTLLSGPFEGLVAYKNAVPPRFPFSRLLLYALLSFPYTLLKNVIQMISIRDELLGKRDWVISSRNPEKPASA